MGKSRIHQSKRWYYLGPFQISGVELVVFDYKLLSVFVNSSNLQDSLFSDASNKHFLCFIGEGFGSRKKARNIYTRMLEFTFPGEDVME